MTSIECDVIAPLSRPGILSDDARMDVESLGACLPSPAQRISIGCRASAFFQVKLPSALLYHVDGGF